LQQTVLLTIIQFVPETNVIKRVRFQMLLILNQLHNYLAAAYGWPVDLPELELLQRLVNLNTQRHQEEQSGLIRWLRPEYQCKTKTASEE
jgi:hypothetical protein